MKMKPILLSGTATYSQFRLDALRAAMGMIAKVNVKVAAFAVVAVLAGCMGVVPRKLERPPMRTIVLSGGSGLVENQIESKLILLLERRIQRFLQARSSVDKPETEILEAVMSDAGCRGTMDLIVDYKVVLARGQ